MDSLSKSFGMRLKNLRDQLDMTQEELAFQCDMQSSHIGQLERGEKNPTLDTLNKIAHGLHIPLPELLDFSIEPAFTSFDETTNRILLHLQTLSKADKEQILAIVKTFSKRRG